MNKDKNQNFYQEFEQQPVAAKSKQQKVPKKTFLEKVKEKNPKSVAILALIVTTVILVLLSLFLLILPKPTPPTPTPSPPSFLSPSPTPYILKPSKYATDSAVLQVEKDLERIQDDLQKVDLKEESLTPPIIDTKITIE